MEGEAQVSTETTPSPLPEAPAETTQTETNIDAAQTPESKPDGFDKVEFTQEQLARVNRIYGNMKRYENDSKELREINQKLIDTVNQLNAGQQQIVNHLQTSDFTDAESKLKSARQEAWSKGDVNAFNDANDQLSEIKVKKALMETQRKQQPEQRQQPNTDGQALVQRARSYGELNGSEETTVQAWMGETGQDGNLKRPWTSSGDPRNQAAAYEAQAVLNSPFYAGKPLIEKLKEIDRRMGVQTQQTTQTNVLQGGNLTRGKATSNIKLDPKIEDLAVRMKFAGKDPKLTAQDHVSAWKRAVEKSKGSKR